MHASKCLILFFGRRVYFSSVNYLNKSSKDIGLKFDKGGWG